MTARRTRTDPAAAMRRTVRLAPTPPQRAAIEATLAAFAAASDDVVAAGRSAGTTANGRLHHLCYRAVRDRYDLSANLAVRAIAHAAARLRDGDTDAPHRPDRLDLDARVLSLQPNGAVSLSTVQGRVRDIATTPGETDAEAGWGSHSGRVLRAHLLHEDAAFVLHLDLAD